MKVDGATDFVMQSFALSEDTTNPSSRTERPAQATPCCWGCQREGHLSEGSDGMSCK